MTPDSSVPSLSKREGFMRDVLRYSVGLFPGVDRPPILSIYLEDQCSVNSDTIHEHSEFFDTMPYDFAGSSRRKQTSVVFMSIVAPKYMCIWN